MGNLIGENLDGYVVSQIKTRETILGSANRTNEQIIWENNKNGWVKLVSSVNVTGTNLSTKYGGGSELAKKYVLFNGVSNGFDNTRAGLDISGPQTNQGAYGLGGPEFGFAPMPGIMSADIKTESRGTLKTGTVQIKANNKEQFEIISTLYIRLGYLMLLEWGHSCYFNDKLEFESDNKATLASEFLAGTLGYKSILASIEAKRKSTWGNYDALCGKVVNYNWKFNKDGSYDITLILRSVGDVIESLKTNVLDPKLQSGAAFTVNTGSVESTSGFDTVDPNRGYVSPDSIIVAFAKSSTIANKFANIQYEFGQAAGDRKKNGMQSISGGWGGEVTHIDYVSQEWYVSGKRVDYYVRFGEFLDFLKTNAIPKIKGTTIPIVGVGDVNATDIVAYKPPRIVPVNPDLCIWRQDIQDYIFFPECEKCIFDNKIRLMYVYFNFVYVLRCIENLKNDKGELKIIDLLNALCKGFNQATGNYSKVSARVDTETNDIVFIDENRLTNGSKATGVFNVYGVYSGVKGSFVRDINLQTSITPELATMITIGSTARGYNTGTDATFLSNLNRGTSPRIATDFSSPDENADKEEETNTLYADAIELYNNYVGYTAIYFPNGNTSEVEPPVYDASLYQSMGGAMRQIVEYDEQLTVRKAGGSTSSPSTGFLPFNLQLTMDGLSGPKIYSKYSINQQFLPNNYPESMDFIVTGVTNNISNNVWTTTLSSMAVPGTTTVGSVPGDIPSPPPKPPLENGEDPDRTGCKPLSGTAIELKPNVFAKGQPPSIGLLRNNIVEAAKKYVGQVAIIDKSFNPKQPIVGFCDPNFEATMRSIGWGKGWHWCNVFATLVYKNAYTTTISNSTLIAADKAKLQTVIDKSFAHDFLVNQVTIFNAMTPGVANTISKYTKLEKKLKEQGKNISAFLIFRPYTSSTLKLLPGDVCFWDWEVDSAANHINVCVSVDYNTRTFQTIGGNEGGRGAGSAVQVKEWSMDSKQLFGIARPPFPGSWDQGTWTKETMDALKGPAGDTSKPVFYEIPPTPPTK